MPSPPRSLEEAVQRIARALADDDGSGWWGEEECGPGHVDAARRLAEAGGVSVLLERLQEAREAIDLLAEPMNDLAEQATSAEARVASLEEALRELVAWIDSPTWTAYEGDHRRVVFTDSTVELVQARRSLAQGAAAPLPATEGGNDGND